MSRRSGWQLRGSRGHRHHRRQRISILRQISQCGGSSLCNQHLQGCTSLTAFNVDMANATYASAAGVLFNQNKTLLMKFPQGLTGSYTMPSSVTCIGAGAFQSCIGLGSITFSASLVDIETNAFY